MTPRTHNPTLVNEEATSWGKRFGSNEDLYQLWCDLVDDLMLHDYVKLRFPNGETCWVEIVLKSSNYWIGMSKNVAYFCPSSAMKVKRIRVGDLVRFHRINVFCVQKAEVET